MAKSRRNYVTIEQFYVAIELARVGRISVLIEDFYAAIELATTESSTAHDRVGRGKVGAHDSVTPCCVATEEAMSEQQTRPGAHDRPWVCTIEVRSRYGNSVTIKGKGSKELYVSTGLFLVATEICVSYGN